MNKLRINQGNIFWLQLDESGYPHPHVVIQNNTLNRSRIKTVVVCAITTNMKLANEPGNVLLDMGEGNLEKQSVIIVSKVSTVKKTELKDSIGSLSERRIEQIFAGMRFQQRTYFSSDNN